MKKNTIVDGEKKCPACGERKPVNEFPSQGRYPNGEPILVRCFPCFRSERLRQARKRGIPSRNFPVDGNKRCSNCGIIKPLEEFTAHSTRRKDGSESYGWCLECHRGYHRSTVGKAAHRRAQLKSKYGLSEADWDKMFADQKGVCAICSTAAATCVDHNHDNGKIRALLCGRCNKRSEERRVGKE